MSRRTGKETLRLSGGRYRGRYIEVPSTARPSEGRLREALLSRWAPELAGGARVLDLYAGSGAIAFEAAGRGALRVLAIEGDRQAWETLLRTRDKLGAGDVEIRRGSLPAALEPLVQTDPSNFDRIFADPPYSFHGHETLLRSCAPLLSQDGEVAIEHSARLRPPQTVDRLVCLETRRYGDSALSFFRPMIRHERLRLSGEPVGEDGSDGDWTDRSASRSQKGGVDRRVGMSDGTMLGDSKGEA